MKIKTILTVVFCIVIANAALAQPKSSKPRSIINTNSSIKTYHERKALETMNKGELISLYKERVRLLINMLPNIALASKPGLSMTDVGIPDSADNRKALDTQLQNTNDFLNNTDIFHTTFLSYSDKINIINCILFYETTLKALNVLNDTE